MITYKDAGVDIDKGNASVELIKPYVKETQRPEVIGGLGGFGGLFAFDKSKYEKPILVSGTDGVGTKLKLAFDMNKHDTIGVDAVAMCVNDILVSGAEPLFFLDYVAVGKLEPEQLAQVVKGIADGCVQSNCALVGGETAEMPGFYQVGEYDVAGFCVGVVDQDKIIDGTKIKPGDVVFGLPSTGLHSNGFSLARKLMLEVEGKALTDPFQDSGKSVGEVMLEPTKIYVKTVLTLLEACPDAVLGMAHITGGGLLENIPRVLPKNVNASLDRKTWPRPAIFDALAAAGNLGDDELYKTFNMGIGYVIIVDQAKADEVAAVLDEKKETYYRIGVITEGDGHVVIQ
ncbi:MAG: phosphoribosylformylglycinamidine cyclo-ligase [Peptococcaceae bacterium]|nr:phosphoribosylformylglycinamidine cyclo-ligase [Peptococcaceae bacterium]